MKRVFAFVEGMSYREVQALGNEALDLFKVCLDRMEYLQECGLDEEK